MASSEKRIEQENGVTLSMEDTQKLTTKTYKAKESYLTEAKGRGYDKGITNCAE